MNALSLLLKDMRVINGNDQCHKSTIIRHSEIISHRLSNRQDDYFDPIQDVL